MNYAAPDCTDHEVEDVPADRCFFRGVAELRAGYGGLYSRNERQFPCDDHPVKPRRECQYWIRCRFFAQRRMDMSLMPDTTFYPSPRMAMQAPPERIAYVALLNVGQNGKRDAMGVIDLDPHSSGYGHLVGQVDFASGDNELHHFGWNACSACLCPH